MDDLRIGIEEAPLLREYVGVLQRRALIVALTVLVLVVVALGFSMIQKPIYSANAKVVVPPQLASSALAPTSQQLPEAIAAQRELADELLFAQGDAVQKVATATLRYPPHVTITSAPSSDLLTFTAESGKGASAAAIANAYAHGFIQAQTAARAGQYASQVSALEGTIADLQAKADALSSKDPRQAALQQSVTSLTRSIQELQASEQLVSGTGPIVVADARVPASPISPNPVRNAILGVVVGLVLGVAFAFLVDRLDDSIHSLEDVERNSDRLPVLGMIPVIDGWRRRDETHVSVMEAPSSLASEAYRTLRTSLQFQGMDRRMNVIGVTSPMTGEGKTTTVANLAVSLARAGQRVVVVSADLRRPRIHRFFGMSNSPGITSVVLGEVSAREALQPVETEPRLQLLASGSRTPNPAEILSLDRVRELVDWLATEADTVILDCPPVLPVTDSLLLSRLVDGMVMVVSAQTTKRRDLQRAVRMLRQVEAPLIGTALNRVPRGRGYDYSYGYSYADFGSDGPSSLGNGTATAEKASRRAARRAQVEDAVSAEARDRVEADEEPPLTRENGARTGRRQLGLRRR